MKTQTPTLWNRINTFDFTAPGAHISFEEKLAADNGWTHGFAMLVTREYRKFLYLTQIAGQMVCPSDEVDQAWHLHLTQTASYAEFCNSVLVGFLHHHASKGGHSELQRHQEMYRFTLSKYEEVFGEQPEPQIWPDTKDRFFAVPVYDTRIEATWSRRLFFSSPAVGFVVMLAVGAMTNGPVGESLWTSVSGFAFLVCFLITILIVSWVPAIFGHEKLAGLSQSALEPYEAAYLEGGADRVHGTAITRLVDLGALTLKAEREEGKPDIKGASCELNPDFDPGACPRMHSIEKELLNAWPEKGGTIAPQR